jgi:hypothetical protein
MRTLLLVFVLVLPSCVTPAPVGCDNFSMFGLDEIVLRLEVARADVRSDDLERIERAKSDRTCLLYYREVRARELRIRQIEQEENLRHVLQELR